MKKKISSKSDLNAIALKSGASVTSSTGQTFNSGKKTAVKRPPIETPPEPKKLEKAVVPEKPMPPLNPATADEGSKLVAESLDSMSKANVMMLAELRSQIAAQPITNWEFDFIRDNKGYLVKLLASAKTDTRTIN